MKLLNKELSIATTKTQKDIHHKGEIIITDKSIVTQKINELYQEKKNEFLNALSWETVKEICSFSYLMQVEPNTKIVETDTVEQEVYVILEGKFEIDLPNGCVFDLLPGEIFGEVGFFLDSGKRTASIHSREKSSVLVILRSIINKIANKNSRAAYEIVHQFGRIIAKRLELDRNIIQSMRCGII